ncbi:MAG TPA: DNA mismatch repair endonuclease MutL [Pyrinomonadaceae bacterium]|jgi:DNA mismatch repair protein MutL
MSKIRVLSDHVANQIAAGEVVERPASVAKELVENSIDAGARRVDVDVEGGGRRLLRVADDGEGMTHDDAVLAFERHATSKITTADDLNRIRTLGFRGEALASIASVARIELTTQTEGADAATRVLIEGGRMRDVGPAARPRGTTIAVRDLFFNVPARRKFLRSEATESFHLTNLITHYALAHPEIAFLLTNNGRETLRAAPAADVRERAYQIFGAEFLDNLLEVSGGDDRVARVRGYVSAPRERRTTRDAQYLFVNGRFVRDRLISRALSEGYRSVLPQGVYPAALLFLDVPLEEVDVNVHPAKTEVRFRRASAVGDAVREAVRAALASGGYLRSAASLDADEPTARGVVEDNEFFDDARRALESNTYASALSSVSQKIDAIRQSANTPTPDAASGETSTLEHNTTEGARAAHDAHAQPPQQSTIIFGAATTDDVEIHRDETFTTLTPARANAATPATATDAAHDAYARSTSFANADEDFDLVDRGQAWESPEDRARTTPHGSTSSDASSAVEASVREASVAVEASARSATLPPLVSAAGLVREVPSEIEASNIRPLGQISDSFIVAIDNEGLLLIDQHTAHERILFEKYRALEATRRAESQNLLLPETFDLTPAQVVAFDAVSGELEDYGFDLMRLSGRTVAIRAVPADLPAGDAHNVLAEVLDSVDTERHRLTRESLREKIAATLAARAAVKRNTPLSQEKMRWLITRLLSTSSPTTGPQGRPTMMRLSLRDIEKSFH